MKDKDTQILEEAYAKINEQNPYLGQNEREKETRPKLVDVINPDYITTLSDLFNILDDRGFDTHEAIQFIDDHVNRNIIDKLVFEVSEAYNAV